MGSVYKKNMIKGNYSIVVLFVICIILLVLIILFQDNIYVTMNDNMDSNIPSIVMFTNNDIGKNDSLPFLGGESNLSVGLSLYSLIFYLFPPVIAYEIHYIIKIALSSIAFFLLAKKIQKNNALQIDPNIWCLCGMLYGMLGTWPSASYCFAFLPWWILSVYSIYKTKKYYYALLLLFFAWNISLMLMGFCALFYTCLFIMMVIFKEKKIPFALLLSTIACMVLYYFLTKKHIIQGSQSSAETVKSLVQTNYSDSIAKSLSLFFDYLMMKGLYHTGGAVFRFCIIPICFLYWLVELIMRKKDPSTKKAFLIYSIIMMIILFNTMISCFNNNAFVRKLVPFASGFSFGRFAWLNPCLWTILFSMACCEIRRNLVQWTVIFFAMIMIIINPCYSELDTMYNQLHINIFALLGNNAHLVSNNEWTWKEFYSKTLFDQIKNEINYNNEWSAAYGLDSAVLQYNGISALDGYYSNYSLSYHDQFQRMIQPELNIDANHKSYWNRSGGIRAYLYSPNWDFLMPKNSKIKEDHLYIDSSVFANDLNGKYLFSRVCVTNADELGFSLLGIWSDEESPYTIYVYTISPDSVQSARAKVGYNKWQNSVPVNKVYGSGSLFTSGNAFSSDDGLLLYPGGSVYGPYKPLKKGHYSVSYFGDNMDIAICDVLSYSSQEYNFTEKSRSSDKIVLDLTVFEDVDNVEYRVFNNVSDEVIQLTQVVVEAE